MCEVMCRSSSVSHSSLEAYLVYLPNNYLIWYKTLVQVAAYEYGALATALEDESLINFDYSVPKLSANAIAGIFSTTHTSTDESKTGKSMPTNEAKDAKAETQAADGAGSPPSSPGLPKSRPTPLRLTANMVLDFPIGNPVMDQAKIMVMKAAERLYEKTPAMFAFIMSTMSEQSKAVVDKHALFRDLQLNPGSTTSSSH
jgi:hypothetical protein